MTPLKDNGKTARKPRQALPLWLGCPDFHDPSCAAWHRHPELEYLYVQSGQAVFYAEGERAAVGEGCGLLINSGTLHRVEAGAGAVIPCAVYSPFFAPCFVPVRFRHAALTSLRNGLCPNAGRGFSMVAAGVRGKAHAKKCRLISGGRFPPGLVSAAAAGCCPAV